VNDPKTKPKPLDSAETNRIVGELCSACALCCNGVLFGDVELQEGDDPATLQQAGLELRRKGKKKCFAQPCSCLEGNLCGIYSDRPNRCRTFECRLLQRALAGEVSIPEALPLIHRARSQVKKIVELLRQLKQADEHLPLSRRYARVMAAPIDLAADDHAVELRSELMLAVGKLSDLLARDFVG
jgi:Fe-S-cluster containining protein